MTRSARRPRHWGGAQRLPCIHCGEGAFCRDENGRPSHKTCAEAARAARAQHGRHGPDDLTTENAA